MEITAAVMVTLNGQDKDNNSNFGQKFNADKKDWLLAGLYYFAVLITKGEGYQCKK